MKFTAFLLLIFSACILGACASTPGADQTTISEPQPIAYTPTWTAVPTPTPTVTPTPAPTPTSVPEAVTAWKTLQGDDKIWDLSWSSDGLSLLAQKYSSDLTVWDLTTGNTWPPISAGGTLINPKGGGWSPDGSWLAVYTTQEVYLFDSQGSQDLHSYAATSWIRQLAWSPDSQQIAIAAGDGRLTILNASDLSVANTYHEFGDISSFSWSADSTKLAIATADGLYIWDQRAQKMLGKHDFLISPVWSPDGQYLAGHFWDRVDILNLASGQRISFPTPNISSAIGIKPIVWSPDGKVIASAHDQMILLWDAQQAIMEQANAQAILEILTGHSDAVYSLAFSPEGAYLASGDISGKVVVWDIPPVLLDQVEIDAQVMGSAAFVGPSRQLYSWNYLGSQTSDAFTVEILRVLICDKPMISKDFSGSPLFDNKPVVVEIIYRVTSQDAEFVTINPNKAIVWIGDESVDLSVYYDGGFVLGDKIDGTYTGDVIGIGGIFFGLQRTSVSEIQQMKITIRGPYDSVTDESFGPDLVFTLDLSDREWQPLPDELKR